MLLTVNSAWLMAAILVSIRVAAATAWIAVFGVVKAPATAKVIIGLSLSAFMVSALGSAELQTIGQLSVVGFAVAAIAESIIGAAFAFGFAAAQAATQFAGRALDIQLGFGAANILNPTTQTPSPLIGTLFELMMVAAFLAFDGHHVLVRALTMSLTALPPSQIASEGMTAVLIHILQYSSVMFVFGLTFAAPIMFVLWLADLSMAIFARSMPQLNVFMLSFAVKIVMGVVGLALTLSVTRAIMENVFGRTFVYWDTLATQ